MTMLDKINLTVEFHEVPEPNGGLRLQLLVDGEIVTTGIAAGTDLASLEKHLGLSRDEVADDLKSALVWTLKNQMKKVTLSAPKEDPQQAYLFYSRYLFRDGDDIFIGLVWYDVAASTTGPEDVSVLIQNAMRTAVIRNMTDEGSVARAVVDLHFSSQPG